MEKKASNNADDFQFSDRLHVEESAMGFSLVRALAAPAFICAITLDKNKYVEIFFLLFFFVFLPKI